MEKYERLEVTVTTFDAEDVITTSGGSTTLRVITNAPANALARSRHRDLIIV